MNENKKPRADAKLKTLPDDRQADIADYARDHSLADTVKWLRADGLETSSGALSQFLSWYSLATQLKQNESTVGQVLEDLKSNNPEMSELQLQQAGQMFFSALAIEQKDSLTWKRIQDAKLKLGILELSRDRFEVQTVELFLKWRKDRQMEELADSTMSQADKIAAMRKVAFADVEKLLESGKLKIPKA